MKLSHFITRLVPAIALCGIACARADHLRLANGDVISGDVVAHENGVIRFSSPILGTLELKESEASIVTAAAKDNPKPKVQSKSSEEQDVDVSAPAENASRWRSKVSVGFNWQDGKKQINDINLRFESEKKSGKNQYRVQTRYRLTDTNGTVSADRSDAAVRWRREFDGRWFTQTNTSYFGDAVREIDLNLEQNAGVGYRLFSGDRAKGNVGAGLTLQYRDATGITNNYAKFGEFFQDLTFRFNDRIELSQEAAALYSPDNRPLDTSSSGSPAVVVDNVPNYRVTFNSVLRGRVTDSVTVNLRYEYELDNAIADRDARVDQRVTTSLGYVF